MARNLSKRIRRIRCRNLNIRVRDRDNVELTDYAGQITSSSPVEERPVCTIEEVPLSMDEKLVKARELMLEAEKDLIKQEGFCPYELGYALKNIDEVINQITGNQ